MSGLSSSRMDRATRSSSEIGISEYIPGVSTTSYRLPAISAAPLETSTVVPG